MDKPSKQDIEQAKAYLRERLDAEQSMARNLSTQLLIFANKLIALFKKYNLTPDSPLANSNTMLQMEITLLVRQLKDELYYDVELLSVHANEEDRDNIIAYINSEKYGQSLKGRISTWSDDVKDMIIEDIKKNGTEKFTSLPMKIGAFYGLDRLLRSTIGTAWMNELLTQNKDAKGFFSFRGSSYPCAICDDYVGYHPIEEYALPLHPNCCCFAVFVK